MSVGLWMIVGSIFGVVCGIMAIPRNRSCIPWWFLGVLSGPIALGVLLRAGHRSGPKAVL
ncbi:MAG: hypothetical protein ACYDCC_07135 [Actinomycetota bacterium]